MSNHPCQAMAPVGGGTLEMMPCGKTDDVKPMCFRGEPWCCDRHKKLVLEQHKSVGNNGELWA